MKSIRIDKDSYGTIALAWCICAVLIWLAGHFINNDWISIPISAVLVVFMLFITWFFRVPDRNPIHGQPKAITSVADGKIVILEKAFEGEYLKRECIQLSIYMDFFDVHANFWPVDGVVSYYRYHPGKKFLAFLPKSSELNEHASSALKVEATGDEIFFKQIAGTFARRIVCYSEPGYRTNRGEQCGVIKFGSRIDMFLPLDADIKVKLGERVKAITTVIAELG